MIRLGDKAECGIDDKTPESLTFESYSTPQVGYFNIPINDNAILILCLDC